MPYPPPSRHRPAGRATNLNVVRVRGSFYRQNCHIAPIGCLSGTTAGLRLPLACSSLRCASRFRESGIGFRLAAVAWSVTTVGRSAWRTERLVSVYALFKEEVGASDTVRSGSGPDKWGANARTHTTGLGSSSRLERINSSRRSPLRMVGYPNCTSSGFARGALVRLKADYPRP